MSPLHDMVQPSDLTSFTRQRAVIVDWGAVTPFGLWKEELTEGLAEKRCALREEDFEGLGPLTVGRVAGVEEESPASEGTGSAAVDRALEKAAEALREKIIAAGNDPDLPRDRGDVFLHEACGQIFDSIMALDFVPAERRSVVASSSKGALLLFLRHHRRAAELFPLLHASDPATSLARHWGATGPCAAYTGACATGLTNIVQAVELVESGRADVAIAGSTEATLHPFYLASFLNLKALSRGKSTAFDADHSGFIAGEGAALVMIASERAAGEAGLRPLARIAGSAFGADAYHPVAIDTTGEAIARTGRLALERAVWDPADLDLVSSHGTATQQNDAAEAAALRSVLGENFENVAVHAFKAACGHLMGAAGAVELAACLACMEAGILPATPGFRTHAPECAGVRVLLAPEQREVRRVLKWSFGFGGHLAAVALERL